MPMNDYYGCKSFKQRKIDTILELKGEICQIYMIRDNIETVVQVEGTEVSFSPNLMLSDKVYIKCYQPKFQ